VIRVCSVDDVPLGEGRAVTINGRPIALYRLPAGWFAVQGSCTHQGGPLADGIAADRSVICPLHERRFDLATGEPLGHDCAALQTFAVNERDGEIFLTNDQSQSRNGGARGNGIQEST
jgi:nitrite reductase (NADH) small subunit